MTEEKVKEYTLRVTQGNKSELIVILCDMLLDYIEDAKDAASKDAVFDFQNALIHAKGCVRQLIGSLHREYDLANCLYELYRFAERQLNKAEIQLDTDPLMSVENMFVKLRPAFMEVASKDTSGAVMKNTQSVYAGMTYGRGNLNENMVTSSNRGFFA